MTAVARIRVLLADDQALIRLGFRMVLSSAPDIELVGEAETGSFAVDLTAALHPDVVLMDVRMPGMDGIEATRRIVSGTPHSRVLILTTFDLDEYAFAGLNAGASGFLLKDAEPPELIGAIRTVARGDAVIAPRVTRLLLDAFADQMPGGSPVTAPSPLVDRLTPRELQVLGEVAAGRSNPEIAARLVLSEATVKTHLGRILTKLELRDRVQAVVFAYRNQLVDERPD
ncbi:MAG TPA: response regulator transcription factor [Nakamurella sp.]|jgi:DNA-binding NarL/FixJ family response regulator